MGTGKQVWIIFLSVVLWLGALPILPALAIDQRDPIFVTGDFTDIDFDLISPTVSNNVYTLDSKFLGTVAITPGSNLAGLAADDEGENAFFMEFGASAVNSYKAGIVSPVDYKARQGK